MKRNAFICTAAAVLIGLSACGENTDNTVQPAGNTETEYVYKGESREISADVKGDFNRFEYYGGKIYFQSVYETDENQGYAEFYLNSADIDGGNYSSVLIAEGDNIYACPPAFGEDGSGYYIEVSRTEEKRAYILKTIDENCAETASADISDIIAGHIPDFLPSGICISGGELYIYGYSEIIILNKDGGFVSAVTGKDSIGRLIPDKNGKVFAHSWNGSCYSLCGIDTAAGQIESDVRPPFSYYGDIFISGGDSGYDFFVSDGTSLFGYGIDGAKDEIFGWARAGISAIEVSDIFYTGNETFICAGKSYPLGYPKISVITKQPDSGADKKTIVLGGTEYGINGLLENSAVKFNAVNDKYFIEIKKYPYENIEQLDLDIISGKIPDILITDSYTPVDNYISKGLFADLYEFIDNDGEMDRGDFLPNLMSACETNGKLYRFTDSFTIDTIIGKSSVFGDEKGITIDRLNEITAGRDPDEIFPASSKSDILDMAIKYSGNDFIDLENNTCCFDSEDFVKTLEFSDRFADEIDYEGYFDSEFWKRLKTMYADESALLMTANISGYRNIFRFEKSFFGEKVTAIGFPRVKGTGTAFVINSGFSVSAGSANKDGAWEFVRALLLPEYQDTSERFPARLDSLEKFEKAAMRSTDREGSYAELTIGQTMIAMNTEDKGDPKQEDIDRVNEIIGSAEGLTSYDSNIKNIIEEESSAYFAGNKTAKEAAEHIQKRVQLYLSERS